MTSGDLVDAQIGKGLDFDGSNDNVDSGMASNAASNITMSAFFKSDDAGTIGDDFVAQRLATQFRTSTGSRFALGLNLDKIAVYWHDGGNNTQEGTTTLSSTPWYYGVVTYDGSTVRLYLNGFEEGSWAESAMSAGSADTIKIGQHAGSRYLDGIEDEVRVSNIARSANWITAEYNNLDDPATFVIEGTPQTP